MISTNIMYKVLPDAIVHGFMLNNTPGKTAHELMDMNNNSDYDEDPLLIVPEAFITYCRDDDTTDIAIGNTNHIQLRVIWSDQSGKEYYVRPDQLVPFALV